VGLVLQVLSVLTLVLALVCGIAAIVDVARNSTTSSILETCSQHNESGNNCVTNLNGEFAVAVLGGAVLLFGTLGIFAEMQIAWVREHLNFLTKFFGRGLFLVLIGICCLGLAGDLGLAAGIANLAVGGILFIWSFFNTTTT